MCTVIPQNHRFLRDAFGSTITDGACVIDADHEVGYVRLDPGPGPGLFGPDSAYWDGWFTVTRTRTRTGHPLRGKVMKGDLVQVLGGDHR
jgi:hypothetical protein